MLGFQKTLQSNSKIIAISGLKNSGKNEVAKMLQYCLSVPKIFRQYWLYKVFNKVTIKLWKIVAFADPLKKSLSVILNVPYEKFNDRDFKENYCLNIDDLSISKYNDAKQPTLTDSKFTKLVRDLDPSIINYSLSIRQVLQAYGTEWMQHLFGNKVWINSTLRYANKNTIISDLRFIEEEKCVHNLNGRIIYVKRPGLQFGNHASEKEMYQMLITDKYDYIIENDGPTDNLFYNIAKLCNQKIL